MPDDKATVSRIALGSFSGDVVVRKGERYFFSLDLASRNGFYRIHAAAKNPEHPLLAPFLNSITLDGQPLMKGKAAGPLDEPPIEIGDLKTSPEIELALKLPDPKRITVTHDKMRADDRLGFNEPDHFSQAAIILRKPYAKYTQEARYGHTSGTIRLKVLLGADGQVQGVIVLKSLPNGLTDSAIDAAKKIKFLPAEKGGTRVDSYTTVEYSFSIY